MHLITGCQIRDIPCQLVSLKYSQASSSSPPVECKACSGELHHDQQAAYTTHPFSPPSVCTHYGQVTSTAHVKISLNYYRQTCKGKKRKNCGVKKFNVSSLAADHKIQCPAEERKLYNYLLLFTVLVITWNHSVALGCSESSFLKITVLTDVIYMNSGWPSM